MGLSSAESFQTLTKESSDAETSCKKKGGKLTPASHEK